MEDDIHAAQQTVFVTGATSFIGEHILKRALAEGARAHILVRPTSDLSHVPELGDNLHAHVYDGTIASVLEAYRIAKPDATFHLAAQFLAEHAPEDIDPLIENVVTLSTHIFEAASQHGGGVVISAGTSWQNYQSDAYRPVCLYAALKQAVEDIGFYYADARHLKLIFLRIFDTYGPGDRRGKLLSLLKKLTPASDPLLMSPGDQELDYVYIDDVVSAFHLAAERAAAADFNGPEAFALKSGRQVKLREFIALYERISGKRLNISWGERPYREREVMKPWASGAVLPGWTAKMSLEDGLGCVVGSAGEAASDG